MEKSNMDKDNQEAAQNKKVNPDDIIWITYKDVDGGLKSAPLEDFLIIAKKRGWKPKKLDEII